MKLLKNRKSIYLIGAVVVIAIAALGFVNSSKNKSFASTGEGENVSVSVETQVIGPETIEQYISVSSKVAADSEVSVIPKASGTVKKVYVNLGDRVKAGDVLFEIDDTAQRLQAEQAKAALASAKASYEMNVGGNSENGMSQLKSAVRTYEIQYDDLCKQLENIKALYEKGAASKQDLDNLQSNVDKVKLQLDTAKNTLKETEKSVKAGVAQAQAALELAQTQLEYTRVKAEIDGVISACSVTAGSMVSSQGAAMTIVNTDKLKLSFNISEDYINKVSVGSKAYITVSAASDTPYEGTVTNISPAANSMTMMYPVEVYMDNADDNVKSGMFASLKLVVDRRENTVSVPLNAVIEKGNEKFVYTVDENNAAHRKAVETGIKNDADVEIIRGLENGEQVVVKGQSFISDGSTVNVAASH